MRFSEHFTLEELTHSNEAVRRGIDNTPPEHVIENLGRLVSALEQTRRVLGSVPIHISSGYRSPELNKLIGGSRHSAHMKGLAADFIAPRYGEPREICIAIAASVIQFDQLIYEGNWVHLGLAEIPNRRQVLTAHFTANGTSYSEGIT